MDFGQMNIDVSSRAPKAEDSSHIFGYMKILHLLKLCDVRQQGPGARLFCSNQIKTIN